MWEGDTGPGAAPQGSRRGEGTDKGAGGEDPGQEGREERKGEGAPVAAGGRRGRARIGVGARRGGLGQAAEGQERRAARVGYPVDWAVWKEENGPTHISPRIQFCYTFLHTYSGYF